MKIPQLFGITALAASVALAGCTTLTTTNQPNVISVIDGKKHYQCRFKI